MAPELRRVVAVGVGAGDPEHMTVAAIRALNDVNVIFELKRTTADLTAAREAIVQRFVQRIPPPRVVPVHEPHRDRRASAYTQAVSDWRSARADAWEQAIGAELGAGESGAFLVWGDPSLYDSTIAVLDEIRARGRVRFDFTVVPGISSIQALTAAHRIALNRLAGAVQITTGRLLAANGWPQGATDLVVMLDGRGAYRSALTEPVDIYWGAYLGTPDELLVAGPLAEVAAEIDRLRETARERNGWIMDTYLLRSRAAE